MTQPVANLRLPGHLRKQEGPLQPHERITHVGGRGWKLTQEDAIGKIERPEWNFYVALPGTNKTVWVEIGVSRFGNKYLRTQGDNDEHNNLLSLPESPQGTLPRYRPK